METCLTCGLVYKQSNKHNQESTVNHTASINKVFRQQCKNRKNIANERLH